MKKNEEIKNNNRWEYEVYKKYKKTLTYENYKDDLENELIKLSKNTSDKLILLKNAKTNIIKQNSINSIEDSIISMLISISGIYISIQRNFSSIIIIVFIYIYWAIYIQKKISLNADYRLEIIKTLINKYKKQIKKEKEYKNELVEFKKKYLSNLITTLKTTQKNIKDDIQEEIDSFKKDLKELNNT